MEVFTRIRCICGVVEAILVSGDFVRLKNSDRPAEFPTVSKLEVTPNRAPDFCVVARPM